MIYKTLYDVIYNVSYLEDKEQKIPTLLKKGIGEESAYGACLIGEVISNGWHYYSFLKALEDPAYIGELRADELSQLDKIKFDLIGIVIGKSDLLKTYLPDRTFKAGKDGKISKDDLNALLKLRENSFLAISSTRLNAGTLIVERDYNILIDFLEKRFERVGTTETLPKTWGRQTAGLVNLYLRSPANDSDTFLDSKLTFLKERLFDGISKTYDIEGEKRTYTTIALFNAVLESEFIELNPTGNRRIIDELYRLKVTNEQIRERIFREEPKLQAKYYEMRREFGLSMLKFLCEHNHEEFKQHITSLQRLGFRESEIRNILEAFIETK